MRHDSFAKLLVYLTYIYINCRLFAYRPLKAHQFRLECTSIANARFTEDIAWLLSRFQLYLMADCSKNRYPFSASLLCIFESLLSQFPLKHVERKSDKIRLAFGEFRVEHGIEQYRVCSITEITTKTTTTTRNSNQEYFWKQ